jgi:hypothetical protein
MSFSVFFAVHRQFLNLDMKEKEDSKLICPGTTVKL